MPCCQGDTPGSKHNIQGGSPIYAGSHQWRGCLRIASRARDAKAFQLREAAAAAAEMHGRRDEEALVRVLLLLSWQFESRRAGPIHTEHAFDY